ncbi:MAG: energy-coupling factor transporter ATP-binding protein EcfA2 [Roseivirga sp.]
MKKITSITLENYRAFYGKYDPILLENGENVLIYGENGSGKSSLFKALRDFFVRSDSALPQFVTHHHNGGNPGEIKVSFTDYDPANGTLIDGTTTEHALNDRAFQNSQPFIQNANLIKGFMDYRRLLDVYYHKDERPDLFEFVVDNLLKNYFITGSRVKISEKWASVEKGLFDSFSRRDLDHKQAIADLPTFESNLRNSLDAIFTTLNTFLQNYFQSGLEVHYDLSRMDFTYNRKKSNWKVKKDLRLNISLNGLALLGYGDTLNEARMSALAICLYLAAQKNVAQAVPYKIIFLDDVFIGLDSGNRIPLTKILDQEFADYQLFITTYDRHWFNMANRVFSNSIHSKWKSFEFYSTPEPIGIYIIDKPLLINNETEYAKAVKYLHNENGPDYPAAANYFRKSIEAMLTDLLPPHEIRNEDFSRIENYRLSDLIKCAKNFLSKIDDVIGLGLVIRLDSYLHSLLHPLSHSNLASPVYKAELLEVERVVPLLKNHLLSINDQYHLFISMNEKYDLTFQVNPNHTGHFKLRAEENHYLYKDTNGAIQVSSGKCRCVYSFDIINGTKQNSSTPSSGDPKYTYLSISNSYSSIYNYLITQPATTHLVAAPNPFLELAYTPKGGIQTTIEDYKNSLAW